MTRKYIWTGLDINRYFSLLLDSKIYIIYATKLAYNQFLKVKKNF